MGSLMLYANAQWLKCNNVSVVVPETSLLEVIMKLYVMSDIHYDSYLKSYHGEMVNFFDSRFLPADTICIAGDIANTLADTEKFLKEISARYGNVVLCLGNHDLTIRWDIKDIYSLKRMFETSEQKMEALQNLCDSFSNVHMLEGRTVTIDGIRFGGCMGMWDFSFLEKGGIGKSKSQIEKIWKRDWFDGVHWNYCGQDIQKIRQTQFEKINSVLSEEPDVMLTHFSPIQEKIPSWYLNDYVSTYFYFDRKIVTDYLSKNPGRVWCSGHIHTSYKNNGMLIHPNAYPEEHSRVYNSLYRKDFLIEL